MWRRLRQSSTALGASSRGALALGTTPVVELMVGDPLPSSGLAWEASVRWTGSHALWGSMVARVWSSRSAGEDLI
jgi:hypothetical protein